MQRQCETLSEKIRTIPTGLGKQMEMNRPGLGLFVGEGEIASYCCPIVVGWKRAQSVTASSQASLVEYPCVEAKA